MSTSLTVELSRSDGEFPDPILTDASANEEDRIRASRGNSWRSGVAQRLASECASRAPDMTHRTDAMLGSLFVVRGHLEGGTDFSAR
jgi:hypothetical protein